MSTGQIHGLCWWCSGVVFPQILNNHSSSAITYLSVLSVWPQLPSGFQHDSATRTKQKLSKGGFMNMAVSSADKSAETIWCNDVNMDHNLCGISSMKNWGCFESKRWPSISISMLSLTKCSVSVYSGYTQAMYNTTNEIKWQPKDILKSFLCFHFLIFSCHAYCEFRDVNCIEKSPVRYQAHLWNGLKLLHWMSLRLLCAEASPRDDKVARDRQRALDWSRRTNANTNALWSKSIVSKPLVCVRVH